MIMERNPPLSREELNETQLHMLKQCDIPGLLPLETEEYDGQISLRYSISGMRMLTEAVRTSNWSMADMMGALCRLAEMLEECRLYLLDADRIRLHDEYIFVGDDWHDLKFTYIPIDMPTLHRADDLERLVIRWMMKVKEPDGKVLQNVLRLVGTAGFMPIVLSRYARQYLAGSVGGGNAVPSSLVAPSLSARDAAEFKPVHTKPPRSWDFFQPVSGDLHPVSEMWGDVPEPQLGINQSKETRAAESDHKGNSMEISRWRILVACVSLFIVAVVWRFLYLHQPTEQKLLVCICLTLISGSGALLSWNGVPNWLKKKSRSQDHPKIREIEESFKLSGDGNGTEDDQYGTPRFSTPYRTPSKQPLANTPSLFPVEDSNRSRYAVETSWISTPSDQTAYLDHKQAPKSAAYCLVWKTKDAGCRIPLQGNSLVIGRSAEAAQHVDETMGISRAHIELVRISEQWKVKDLGSRNGSRLNDKPMAPYELYALQTGDCLTLANSQYSFQHGE